MPLTNRVVATQFVRGNHESGQGANLSFSGDCLRSYRTPIARRIVGPDGQTTILVSGQFHSMTTATKHLPVVRLACMRNGIPFFVVADPFAPLTAEWERRFEACGELNRSILATRQPAAVRARRAKLQYQLAEFRDFANHFQLDPVPV